MPPRQAFPECQRTRAGCEEAQLGGPRRYRVYSLTRDLLSLNWDLSTHVLCVECERVQGHGGSCGAVTGEQYENRWDQQRLTNITEVRNEHDVSHSSVPDTVGLCVMSATPGAESKMLMNIRLLPEKNWCHF